MIGSPSPEKIKTVRTSLGYTQKEAAEMVHVTPRAWQLWEAGQRHMPSGLWELCIIKAGLHPLYKAPGDTGKNRFIEKAYERSHQTS